MALDLWDPSVGSPEVTVNAALVAASHILTYANRAKTTSGLNWGYYGGRYSGVAFDNGVLALTDDSDNYIVAPLAGGAPTVATTTTNWDDDTTYGRCYKLTTADGLVVGATVEDHRAGALGILGGSGSGGGGGSQTVKIVTTFPYTFIESDSGKLLYFATTDGSNAELPDDLPEGWWVDVQNQSANAFSIEVTGGSPLGTVNGSGTLSLDIGQGAHIGSSGTDFYASVGMAGYSLPAMRVIDRLVVTNETTPLVTGGTFKYRQVGDNYFDGIRASLNVAQVSGATLVTVDIKVNTVSRLSTLLTIDNTELTSKTAAVPAVISDGSLVDDDLVEISWAVQSGSIAAGLKVSLLEYVQEV